MSQLCVCTKPKSPNTIVCGFSSSSGLKRVFALVEVKSIYFFWKSNYKIKLKPPFQVLKQVFEDFELYFWTTKRNFEQSQTKSY